MQRREFVKRTAVGTVSLSATLHMCDIIEQEGALGYPTSGGMGVEEAAGIIDRRKERNIPPKIRAEILNNPRSVFIIETHVDARKDAAGTFDEAIPQINAEGRRISKLIFEKGDGTGGSTFIKPNFTRKPEHTFYRTSGVFTQPDFLVGMVEELRNLGNTNVALAETASPASNRRLGKVYEAFDPADILFFEPGYLHFSDYNKNEINWLDAADSLIWKKIPYFRPVGDTDNFLINVSTLKCHLTGITTLSVKNLQGTVAKDYCHFCTSWDQFDQSIRRKTIDSKYFQKNWLEDIAASNDRHYRAGFKRFDKGGNYQKFLEAGGIDAYKKARKDGDESLAAFTRQVGGQMQFEMWMNRGLDSAATIKPAINIVEGIIGLDGEELNRDKIGEDQLVNVVIAGISPFEVDAVGTYIMGHDPKEVFYTRVAKERGLGECDPTKIDINFIKEDGTIVPVKNLAEIKRHPLGVNWARKADPDERLFW